MLGVVVFQSEAKGLSIADPLGTHITDEIMNAFIDDVKLFHGDPSNSKIKVIQNASHDIQLWLNIQWVTGGRVNLGKSFCTPILWEFDQHGHPQQIEITGSLPEIKDPTTSSLINFPIHPPSNHPDT